MLDKRKNIYILYIYPVSSTPIKNARYLFCQLNPTNFWAQISPQKYFLDMFPCTYFASLGWVDNLDVIPETQ